MNSILEKGVGDLGWTEVFSQSHDVTAEIVPVSPRIISRAYGVRVPPPRRAGMSEWQPIETANTDMPQQVILGFWRADTWLGKNMPQFEMIYWDDDMGHDGGPKRGGWTNGNYADRDNTELQEFHPTHWCIPEPHRRRDVLGLDS